MQIEMQVYRYIFWYTNRFGGESDHGTNGANRHAGAWRMCPPQTVLCVSYLCCSIMVDGVRGPDLMRREQGLYGILLGQGRLRQAAVLRHCARKPQPTVQGARKLQYTVQGARKPQPTVRGARKPKPTLQGARKPQPTVQGTGGTRKPQPTVQGTHKAENPNLLYRVPENPNLLVQYMVFENPNLILQYRVPKTPTHCTGCP